GVHRPLLPAEEKVLGGRMSEIGIKDLRFGFASSNPRSIAAAGPPAGRCNPFVGRPERRTTDETLPRPSDSLDSADQLCVAGIGRYHPLLARAGHARDDFACACRLRFVRRLVFHSRPRKGSCVRVFHDLGCSPKRGGTFGFLPNAECSRPWRPLPPPEFR